jgi:hypothetical protein
LRHTKKQKESARGGGIFVSFVVFAAVVVVSAYGWYEYEWHT